jgi:hypothetical protein
MMEHMELAPCKVYRITEAKTPYAMVMPMVSATYQAGAMKIFAHHVTQESGGRREYHMTQVRGFMMTDSRETFAKGASAFRNVRELARKNRLTFIKEANAKARELDERTLAAQVDPSDRVTAFDDGVSLCAEFVGCYESQDTHNLSSRQHVDKKDDGRPWELSTAAGDDGSKRSRRAKSSPLGSCRAKRRKSLHLVEHLSWFDHSPNAPLK